MKNMFLGVAIGLSLTAGSMGVNAADTPTTAPAKHATSRPIKLEQPYAKLDGLTDVQRSKILEIHHKALVDEKAIRDKEEEGIRDVLTDDQKAQLDKLLAEHKEEVADKAKAKKKASTDPST